MTTPRYGTLFHFTHMDNAPSILAAGELLCDSAVCENTLLTTEAGDPEIKTRRRDCEIGVAPYGVVADYVPFYFAARSPMMLKLARGSVPSFTGDHRDLVYFVTSVSRLMNAGLPLVVSDRNAAKSLAAFSNEVAVLGDLDAEEPESEFIDWPLMRATMWNNTPDDPERMERRMAELLVLKRVPLDVISRIAVYSEDRTWLVKQALQETDRAIRVIERPDWYF